MTRPSPGLRGVPGTDMDATLSGIEFMTGSRDEPFFLYLHYMDLHQYLYTDLSPNFGSSFSDFYDASIFWTDYNIGRVMQALVDLEIADRTLVTIVSDHGEAFFEHGIEGHARNLYREVLDTPWIILLPFELERGIVVEQRVGNIDVWPTLLEMLGLQPLPGAEGESALPLILAAAAGEEERARGGEAVDRAVFSQLDRSWGKVKADPSPLVSIVKGTHRLNYFNAGPDGVELIELYDRSVDPGETTNVAIDQPEVARALKADVEAFLAKPRTEWSAAPEIEIDELQQGQLRALGYVIEGWGPNPGKGPAVPRSPALE